MSYMPQLAEQVSAIGMMSGNLNWLGRLVVGKDPRIIPVQWFVSPTLPEDVPSWADFTGDPEATRLPWPARYRRIGEVCVNRELLKAPWVNGSTNGRLAIAYRFAETAVMVAPFPHPNAKRAFGPAQAFHARIGHHDVGFTAGYVDHSLRLTVPEGAVRAGSTFPLSELPKNGTYY